MSSLRCRPVALFLLTIFLAGCTTWRPTTVSPRQAIEERPDRVRLTLLDSTTIVVSSPVVVNDSVATAEPICQEQYPGGPRTCVSVPTTVLPLSEVAGLELRRENRNAPALFMFAALVGAVVYVFIIDAPNLADN